MSSPFVLDELVKSGTGSSEDEGKNESFVLEILNNVLEKIAQGDDLSKVSVPVFFIEPRSLLEKFTDIFTHVDLLIGLCEEQDDFKRFLGVLKFWLSAWHILPVGCKKPYNPVIGEQFMCFWDHTDGSHTDYLSEQVSHHPPISACYAENRKNNIAFNGYMLGKGKYTGNSVLSKMLGVSSLYFTNRANESYTWNYPSIYACGLLIGTLRLEFGGDPVVLRCEKTGYEATIEFLQKPIFGGSYHSLEGVVKNFKTGQKLATLSGNFDSVVKMKDSAGVESAIFDLSSTAWLRKIVVAPSSRSELDSRKVWDQLTAAILSGDSKLAAKAKDDVENHQRDLAKAMKDSNQEHVVKFFDRVNNDQWVYKDLCLDEYDEFEERKLPAELDLIVKSYYESKS